MLYISPLGFTGGQGRVMGLYSVPSVEGHLTLIFGGSGVVVLGGLGVHSLIFLGSVWYGFVVSSSDGFREGLPPPSRLSAIQNPSHLC